MEDDHITITRAWVSEPDADLLALTLMSFGGTIQSVLPDHLLQECARRGYDVEQIRTWGAEYRALYKQRDYAAHKRMAQLVTDCKRLAECQQGLWEDSA